MATNLTYNGEQTRQAKAEAADLKVDGGDNKVKHPSDLIYYDETGY